VSQAIQGKIDEGFANLLKSHLEDAPYHGQGASVFKLAIYDQFEQKIRDYIFQHSQLYQNEERKTISRSFVDSLVSSMDAESRILSMSMVEKIRRNLDSLADKDNRFSRLQIFLCLQDLCLAMENALKNKNQLTGTLKKVLDDSLSRTWTQEPPWKNVFDGDYRLAIAIDASRFESNLKSILAIEDPKVRRLLVCCAVRNFSSHNLDVGSQFVFGNVQLIFENILSSFLFLHDSGCL